MVPYEPYAFTDAPEPTDEELAEIEAAVDAAEPLPDVANFASWYHSGPVQQALCAVGYPDGTASWIVEFSGHLLAYTDSRAELLETINAPRLIARTAEWQNAYQEACSKVGLSGAAKGGRMIDYQPRLKDLPTDVVYELLDHMTFQACAWYLGVTERELVRCMWPATEPAKLAKGAQAVLDGHTLRDACKISGLSDKTLSPYLNAMRIQRRIRKPKACADGRVFGRGDQKERAFVLADEGVGVKEITAQLADEFGEAAAPYHTIYYWLRRRAA